MRFVKITDHNLESVYAFELGQHAIQYKVDEWVYPTKGSIFCYRWNDKHDYSEWRYGLYRTKNLKHFGRRCFECEVFNPTFYDELWIPSLNHVFKHVGSTSLQRDNIHYWSVYNIVLTGGVKLVREIFPKE